jgi:hypothetical protein
MKTFFKVVAVIAAVLSALYALLFVVYWFNADMKLVRKIYDKLQLHYDSLEKDRKL